VEIRDMNGREWCISPARQAAIFELRDGVVISSNRDPAVRAQAARMCMVSFDTFFQTYWPGLVRFLKARASNSRFAEDVASQAMIAAADRWDELLTYERPDCWLFKVAIRMLSRLEARARRDGWLCEAPEAVGDDLRIEALRDEWVDARSLACITCAITPSPRRHGCLTCRSAPSKRI
jgi:hypothetical protein